MKIINFFRNVGLNNCPSALKSNKTLPTHRRENFQGLRKKNSVKELDKIVKKTAIKQSNLQPFVLEEVSMIEVVSKCPLSPIEEIEEDVVDVIQPSLC